jgi:antitoxin CptB
MKKLDSLKKKLLYRSNYRGTKELDILLSGFVKKHINDLTEEQLLDLDVFLDFEDSEIYDFYRNNITSKKFESNKISNLLKITKFNGGEGGIRTHERVAPLLVFKTSAFNRSATSP